MSRKGALARFALPSPGCREVNQRQRGGLCRRLLNARCLCTLLRVRLSQSGDSFVAQCVDR